MKGLYMYCLKSIYLRLENETSYNNGTRPLWPRKCLLLLAVYPLLFRRLPRVVYVVPHFVCNPLLWEGPFGLARCKMSVFEVGGNWQNGTAESDPEGPLEPTPASPLPHTHTWKLGAPNKQYIVHLVLLINRLIEY